MQIRQTAIPFDELRIDRQELYRAMGYGDERPEQEIDTLLDEVLAGTRRICKPHVLYRICGGHLLSPLHIEVAGVTLRPGKIITESLAGATHFCLFVVTAGPEFEEFRHAYSEEGDCVREFIADAVGSVVAEACVAYVERCLDAEHALPHTYPYSPGYCGWKLSEQQLLFGMLPEEPCGVVLTGDSLMLPIKSVSGIIGLGAQIVRKPYGCAICRNRNCFKRREQPA